MSHPAPSSTENRDSKRQRADDSPLDSAPSEPPISVTAPIGSTGSSDSAAAMELQAQSQSPPPQSIAQRCHTDALHCIFAFLGLKELLPALHACRQWWAAGCKELSRGLAIRTRAWPIASVAASPLRHHVANVTIGDVTSLDQLRELRALPRLTALSVSLDAAELEALLESAGDGVDARQQRGQLLSAAFPAQLRSIGLKYCRDDFSSVRAGQSLVDALPSMPSLRTVVLGMHRKQADLSPLLHLPQLSDLCLSRSLSSEECAVIKRLSALTALRVARYQWDPAALLGLLEPPHALQRLEVIELDQLLTFDRTLLAAMLSLPALTALRPKRFHPDGWAGLGALTQLRTLRLQWTNGIITAAHSSALESSLHALPLLTDLELGAYCELPRALRLPAIRRLHLAYVRLPSFGFLPHCPSLESLTLFRCRPMSADDLLDALIAHPPLCLSELRLDRCEGLDQAAEQRLRAALDPPSALLPQLCSFHCRRVGGSE